MGGGGLLLAGSEPCLHIPELHSLVLVALPLLLQLCLGFLQHLCVCVCVCVCMCVGGGGMQTDRKVEKLAGAMDARTDSLIATSRSETSILLIMYIAGYTNMYLVQWMHEPIR